MSKKVNPWAVCHASTGPKKSAKFERCVKKVKKNQGIEEMQTLNLMSDKIVEGLQFRLEEQQLIENIMLFCEENEIDIDSLNEEELNEFISALMDKMTGKKPYKTPPHLMRKFTTGGNKDAKGNVRNPKTRDITFAGGEKKNLKKGAFASDRARKYLDAANLATAYKRKNLGMGIQKNLESMNLIGQMLSEGIKKLIGKQKKLDVNKSGSIDTEDLKILRAGKKKVAESSLVELKKETYQSYAKKAAAQVDSGKTPEKKELKRIKGIGKAETKAIKASMGPNNRKNTFKPKPKLNQNYIKAGKKGPSETPMSTEKINQSGVGGKPAAGRPGQTKADVLDKKLAKIDATSKAFMGKLAKNPKNSQK